MALRAFMGPAFSFAATRAAAPVMRGPLPSRAAGAARSAAVFGSGLAFMGGLTTTAFADALTVSPPDWSAVRWQALPGSSEEEEEEPAATMVRRPSSKLVEVVGGTLLDGAGAEQGAEAAFEGKSLVGLYFGRKSCRGCRAFTPKLKKLYEKSALGQDDDAIEIVFGSSDGDEDDFEEYFAEMPWKAFPWGDDRVKRLKRKYGVNALPWLVILDREGNVVHNEADTAVNRESATTCIEAWKAGNEAGDRPAPSARRAVHRANLAALLKREATAH